MKPAPAPAPSNNSAPVNDSPAILAMPIKFRKTQVTVIQQGESLFNAINKIDISIEDYGGGEFLKIKRGDETFSISPEEIAIFCSALQYLGKECR